MTTPLYTIATTYKAAGLTRAFLRLKRLTRDRLRMRLQTIIGILGQDGLLALNALLALLNIVLSPLQGISLPLGFIQVMIMSALLRGRRTFWMPRRWQVYSLSAARLGTLLDKWLPSLYRLEKISHPRLGRIMRRRDVHQVTSWLLFLLAVVVALPIPFMNITPSLAALFLCLALINSDGLMWVIGLAVVLAHSALFFFWHAFYPLMMTAVHRFI